MAELFYGFDPLCGWCCGIVPAVWRVPAAYPDVPVRLVMEGLVSGDRVGPCAATEGYIRGAACRLREVTGRGPGEAFFRLIATNGVRGDSGVPCIPIAHVAGHVRKRAMEFVHQVIETHFKRGADLNELATYEPMLEEAGTAASLPDLHDPRLAQAVWEEGRRIGLRSFPTLATVTEDEARVVPRHRIPRRSPGLRNDGGSVLPAPLEGRR